MRVVSCWVSCCGVRLVHGIFQARGSLLQTIEQVSCCWLVLSCPNSVLICTKVRKYFVMIGSFQQVRNGHFLRGCLG